MASLQESFKSAILSATGQQQAASILSALDLSTGENVSKILDASVSSVEERRGNAGQETSTASTTAASELASLPASKVESAVDSAGLKLARDLLETVVRPAFSKDRSKNVTAAGRKAMDMSYRPPERYDSDEIRRAKPWKHEAPWVVDVLDWCLSRLDKTSVEPNWHLVIPPILSIIDDIDTPWRIRGCKLLRSLLSVTTDALLQRTGIGEVFEQALLAYLLHLPPLTEEPEALELLRAVYPTLLALTRARFPKSADGSELNPSKIKTLDRVLRQGVLRGLGQVSDNVNLSVLLLEQLSIFVDELQIDCVKHLKIIFPMLEARISGPFVTASPQYLQYALAALKTVQINAWPRVPFHRMQIISALCIAQCRIEDDRADSNALKIAANELTENLKVLKAILNNAKQGSEEIVRILESDGRLSGLLTVWSKDAG